MLGAAVLASAAVPMASAAPADVSINLQEDYIFVPDTETVSASFGEDGSVMLTLLEGTEGSLRHMMWIQTDEPFVNLAEAPTCAGKSLVRPISASLSVTMIMWTIPPAIG